jgi:hypothetical protein
VTFNPDKPTRIGYRAALPAQLIVTFETAGAGALAIDWLYSVSGLPPGAPTPQGPPTNWTQLSHTRTAVGATKLDWK